jgi:hypothetical protein
VKWLSAQRAKLPVFIGAREVIADRYALAIFCRSRMASVAFYKVVAFCCRSQLNRPS